jgi:hypothetical protein
MREKKLWVLESIVRRGLCRLVRAPNRAGGRVLVPVARGDVVVRANIVPAETKVIVAQRTIRVVEVAVVRDDAIVIADLK